MRWLYLDPDRVPYCDTDLLIEPLRHPSRIFHAPIPFFAGYDLVDEMMYVAQRAPGSRIIIDAGDGIAAADYAESSAARRDLCSRLPALLLANSGESLRRLKGYRCVGVMVTEEGIGQWIRHEFSMVPKTGLCEDCGMGKHETALHFGGISRLGAIVARGSAPEFVKRQAAVAGIPVWYI